MKKILLSLLPILISFFANSQDEDFDVKINTPPMRDLINHIWVRLPNRTCTVPEGVNVNGEELCAAVALKHFRFLLTECDISDGMKEALKTEFKLIKLIPVGRAAGFLIDVADLTAKAFTAESPEALASDLANFGFGRIAGEQVGDKLKDLLGPGASSDALNSLVQAYMDHLWDLAKDAIIPSEASYECHTGGDPCTDNLHMTIQPYHGDNPRIIAMFVYSANGDCGCKIGCAPGTPKPLLKTWEVHGEMPLMIESAAVVEEGVLIWKKKVLRITLSTGAPSFTVTADCGCDNTTNTSNVSYHGEENYHHLFAGASVINEDAGDRFNFYGVNVAYTKMLSTKIGVTGDAGVYFAKQEMLKYTRLQAMVGPSFLPPNQNRKLVFQPHLLAGVNNTKSKYSSFSSSNTFLAAALGTDVMIKVSNKANVVIRVDYNPIFQEGGTAHNFRIGVGGNLF